MLHNDTITNEHTHDHHDLQTYFHTTNALAHTITTTHTTMMRQQHHQSPVQMNHGTIHAIEHIHRRMNHVHTNARFTQKAYGPAPQFRDDVIKTGGGVVLSGGRAADVGTSAVVASVGANAGAAYQLPTTWERDSRSSSGLTQSARRIMILAKAEVQRRAVQDHGMDATVVDARFIHPAAERSPTPSQSTTIKSFDEIHILSQDSDGNVQVSNANMAAVFSNNTDEGRGELKLPIPTTSALNMVSINVMTEGNKSLTKTFVTMGETCNGAGRKAPRSGRRRSAW